MKKEEITSIEKIKCPYCKREIIIDAEVVIPQNRFKLMVVTEWFNIRTADYTGPDSVIFREHGPPVPETWHWFRCVDASGTAMTPEFDGQFKPDGSGESEELVANGIRDLTEAKVVSREWFWQAKKKL